MKIFINKTTILTISKYPLSCKLEIENKTTEQIMNVNYLGLNIMNRSNLNKKNSPD